MKKLCLGFLLFALGASAAFSSGEQFIDAYNNLVKALNPRLEILGSSPMALKQKGDGVSQTDLNSLRGTVLSLGRYNFLLDNQPHIPQGGITTDSISDYFIAAFTTTMISTR